MKRKTNLFYLSGDESNFLTFSNYGESLTANSLATDWKLFPSRFLCLYIKYLDTDNIDDFKLRKEAFIKYLTRSYENKMAFLRDCCVKDNKDIEQTLLPLNYLLESLLRIGFNTENPNNLKVDEYSVKTLQDNENVKLTFVGNITEQDYNGTYTDIINIINSKDYPVGEIVFAEADLSTTNTMYNYNFLNTGDELNLLYGWNAPELTGGATITNDDFSPIFDTDEGYYVKSFISKIVSDETTIKRDANIKFNILVPLFDLVNISLNTNNTVLDANAPIILNNDENGIATPYIANIPLGVWVADNLVELKRNKETGYSPAWSLMLSTQFKPFPYSQKIPSEISQNATKEAFATYSQILFRQNTLLEQFENVLERVNELKFAISTIESKLNTLGTAYTSDVLRRELLNFEKDQNDKMTEFKNEVYSYMLNKWKGYIG